MAEFDSLSATEDVLWRALMRIVVLLPRRLDDSLLGAVGISANEYLTLMFLSEAPGGALRMSDLADATALSPSRITRLIGELQSRGFVTKRASAEDRRGNVACLTPAGVAKVKVALGVHVSRLRALVLDHVDPSARKDAASALAGIALRLEDSL
jgi:DNA-binding MarR family transcriptional regulator